MWFFYRQVVTVLQVWLFICNFLVIIMVSRINPDFYSIIFFYPFVNSKANQLMFCIVLLLNNYPVLMFKYIYIGGFFIPSQSFFNANIISVRPFWYKPIYYDNVYMRHVPRILHFSNMICVNKVYLHQINVCL